jgi:hypothetical protein
MGETAVMVNEFPCPFCGRRAGFVEDPVRPAVTHARPLCSAFELMDAHDYARAVNDARFGQRATSAFRMHAGDQNAGGM